MVRRSVLALALVLQVCILGLGGVPPRAEATPRHGRASPLEKRVVEVVNQLRGVNRLAPEAQARVLEQFHGSVAQLAAELPTKARGHNQLVLATRVLQARSRQEAPVDAPLRKAYLAAFALIRGVLDVRSGIPYAERRVKTLERKVRRANREDLATLDRLAAKVSDTFSRRSEALFAEVDVLADGWEAPYRAAADRLSAQLGLPQVVAARRAWDEALLATLPDYAAFRREEAYVQNLRAEHEVRNEAKDVLEPLMRDASFSW